MHTQLLVLAICIGAILGAPAPNGSKFNPSTVGGPLSKDQMSLLSQISYLGEFNNKEFFIVRDYVDQATAKANCAVVGLKLAKFEQQSELDFIYDVTSSDDDYSWADGVVHVSYSDGSSVNSDIDINDVFAAHHAGLVIDRYGSATKLSVSYEIIPHYYLCYV